MSLLPVVESRHGGWHASRTGHPAHRGGFMRHATSFIVKAVLAFLISGGILATNAQAQYLIGAKATIPFPFSAQRQNMSAGVYQVKVIPDPFLLAIQEAGTGRDFIFTVRPETSQSAPSHGYLIFRRDAGHLYLAEIHLPGTHTYSVVIHRQRRNTANAKIALSNNSTNIALR